MDSAVDIATKIPGVSRKRDTNDLTGCHDYLGCRWSSWCRYHPAPPPRQHAAIHLAPARLPLSLLSLAPTIAIALEPLLIASGHAIIMLPPSSDGPCQRNRCAIMEVMWACTIAVCSLPTLFTNWIA